MEKTIRNRRIDFNTTKELAIAEDYDSGMPKSVEFKVDAEAANLRNVSVRLSSVIYEAMAKDSVKLGVYISRSRYGDPIEATPPTIVVTKGRKGKVWALVSGQPMFFDMQPDDMGLFAFSIATIAHEHFYVHIVLPDGTLACSNVIAFADTDAPIVEITAPLTGTTVKGTEALTFTKSDGTASARVGSSAAWAPVATGALLNTLSGWAGAAEGAIAVHVRAIDADGNIGADDVALIKDTVAPTVVITAPLDGVSVNGASLFEFTNDDPLATVEARIGVAAWAAVVSGAAMSTLSGWGAAAEGAIALELRATDAVGNVGSTSKAPVKDTVGPVMTITFPTDPSSTDGTDLLAFTTDETAVVEAKIGAGTWAEVTNGVTVVSAVDGYAAVLEDATFTMNFRATDGLGNVSTLDVANITKNETP